MAFIISLWNKILGQFKQRVFTTENIYSTRVIYDLWTCSCIDEYKPELRQHLKLWHKFAPFPPVKTPKTILDFTAVVFQKEKHFIVRNWAMNFLTTTLRSVHTSANLIFYFSNKNGKRKYYLSLSYLHILRYRKK